jgi:hypothetical protein
MPKPELLHPKTTAVPIVNSSGFVMQQFWFWAVKVVEKRCVGVFNLLA